MRGILRCDAGSGIGLGHASRLLALAHVLLDSADLVLCFREMPAPLAERFRAVGVALEPLGSLSRDAEIAKLGSEADFVVLDGYGFDTEYESRLRGCGLRVVTVDDLSDRYFAADVVINHSPGIRPDAYATESYTRLCLGLQYAMLQPVFRVQRQRNRNTGEGSRGRVFINMGGADPTNITGLLLRAVASSPATACLDVVVGGSNPHREALVAASQQWPEQVYLHSNLAPDGMADLLSICDVGICTASTVALEACAMRLPLLVCWVVDNQRSIYSGLVAEGMATGLGRIEDINGEVVARRLEGLLQDSGRRSEMLLRQTSAFAADTQENLRACILDMAKR
jgi:UDP-2,4-diacetamido-2,4,6-trideoxy-beta-L-altropyranose hydrolase